MSDDEFDDHLVRLVRRSPSTVAVSLRVAPDLLGRVRRQAARVGLPEQALLSALLEAGISRLERGRSPSTTKGRGTARKR
jgi:predicted DNA binding CopG/RHH family protein